MIRSEAATARADGKGWFVRPWNSDVPVAIGWAERAVDDPHRHQTMHEIYLVARGHAVLVVDGQRIALTPGVMVAVEPGERHTVMDSSPDYLHFVVQAPFTPGDKASSP